MKIFLDTNIYIRFFTKDKPEVWPQCQSIFQLVIEEKINLYISNIVVAEILFVLIKTYKFAKNEVIADILKFLKLKNTALVEKTNTNKALDIYNNLNLKYGDCLIASQIPHGVTLCTYDTDDFKKIPNLKIASPSELIQNFS